MKFQGIRLLVNDFDAMFKFYSEMMGFKVTWGSLGETYASFLTGQEVGISIFKAEDMDHSLGIPYHQDRRLMDTQVIVMAVEDINPYYERLKDQVVVVMPPKDMTGWGCRCFHIRDVEGNLIEFNSALDKEKWDDDLIEASKKY